MRRILATAAGALALVLTALSGPSDGATPDDPMVFGAFPGVATKKSTLALESSIGRSLAFVRVYDRWDDTFPNTQTSWMKSTGHTLFLSIRARRLDGTNVSWQAIADAEPGDPLHANMVQWARQIKAYELPIYVSFNHEPETTDSVASGTPAQYIAAYRQFLTVMEAEGVTNATWAWTAAARNFVGTTKRYAPDYYPGDAWVDVIAIDAYNMYCQTKTGAWANPWRSLSTLLTPFMTFASDHPGPALVVAEFGSAEDPAVPTRKAQWINDAARLFKQPGYERFEAVAYWNSTSHTYANCDFKVTTSTNALNAYKAMAHDPFYSGMR